MGARNVPVPFPVRGQMHEMMQPRFDLRIIVDGPLAAKAGGTCIYKVATYIWLPCVLSSDEPFTAVLSRGREVVCWPLFTTDSGPSASLAGDQGWPSYLDRRTDRLRQGARCVSRRNR
jgi:hypothetical protein